MTGRPGTDGAGTTTPVRGRTCTATATVFLSVLLSVVVLAASPTAHAADAIEVTASIDGRPAASANERHPISLRPGRTVEVDLQVINRSDSPLEVRSVRLEGKVMSLTFFAYDTAIGMTVAPGATESRRYPLDLVGLRGQATGLIQAKVMVLDGDHHARGSQSLVVDVRGSLWSVYGLFGLAALVLAVMGLGGFFLALSRHTLSPNRWSRAMRLVAPGVGLGLVIVFLLSALRVFVPRPGRWAPIVLITAAVAFAAGYLTPTPDDDDGEDDGGDDDDDSGAPAPRIGEPMPRRRA